MNKRHSCPSLLRGAGFAVLVLAAAAAQQQPIPGFGLQPIPGFGAQPMLPQQQLFQRSVTDQLQSTWVQPRRQMQFTGFPVFPSRLSDYSKGPGGGLLQALVQGQGLPGLSIPGLGIPGLGGPTGALPGFGQFPGQAPSGLGRMPPIGQLQPSDGDPLPLPEAEPEVGWPNWASTRDREPLPFSEHLALLVRHGDRVWWKLPEEEAMVPLYFHDKFRTLTEGSAVEVRQSGEFELLMHRSTRVVARGRTAITLQEMNPDKVRFVVQSLTRLAITAGGRVHQIELPDGSQLSLTDQDVTDDETMSVLLERAVEPGWLGGRASLFNVGSSDVRWQFGVQSITIPPGHRVVFFLTPPATPYAEQLLTEGARASIEDGIMVVKAVEEVGVSWSGARFQVPAGSELRLDPLQGQPFTKAMPARSAQ